jgi:hypothetical protein
MPRADGSKANTASVLGADAALDKLASIVEAAKATGGKRVLAVDPGDDHVGVAAGVGLGQGAVTDDELLVSFETTPSAWMLTLRSLAICGWVDVLVMEDFVLIPDRAMQQSGSRMHTARLLGAMGWLVADHNLEVDYAISQAAENGGALPDGGGPAVPIYPFYQQPSIKATQQSILRSMGVKPEPCGNSVHARDAQLHWWHFVMGQRGLLTGIKPAAWDAGLSEPANTIHAYAL